MSRRRFGKREKKAGKIIMTVKQMDGNFFEKENENADINCERGNANQDEMATRIHSERKVEKRNEMVENK